MFQSQFIVGYFTIIFIFIFAIENNCQTCGEGPWISPIESELIGKLTKDNDKSAETLRNWDIYQKSYVTDYKTQKIPDFCKPYFQSGKTCCSQTSINLIRQIINSYVYQFTKYGRTNQLDTSKYNIAKSISLCLNKSTVYSPQTIALALPLLNTNTSTTTQNNAASSSFTTNIVNQTSTNTTTTTNLTQANSTTTATSTSAAISSSNSDLEILALIIKEESALKNKQLYYIAQFARATARLLRSTLCILCMDPDNVNIQLFDGVVQINEADYLTFIETMRKSLLEMTALKPRYAAYLQFYSDVLQKNAVCPNVDKTLLLESDQFNTCFNDVNCTQTSAAIADSAYAMHFFENNLTLIDQTLAQRFNMRRRILATSNFITVQTGGLTSQTADDEWDANLPIGDSFYAKIVNDSAAADSLAPNTTNLNYGKGLSVQGINYQIIIHLCFKTSLFLFAIVYL